MADDFERGKKLIIEGINELIALDISVAYN
ncbi:hypothetical protein ES703_51169 [subsurface metagenome]